MIKREELRFDNWVLGSIRPEEPVQINSIDKTICKAGEYLEGYESVNPIPLTEEWLIRMGFEIEKYPVYLTYKIWVGDFKLIYRVHNARKSTELWLEGNGAYDEYGEADLTDICKYVHSLQNIYFALTGKELTIK